MENFEPEVFSIFDLKPASLVRLATNNIFVTEKYCLLDMAYMAMAMDMAYAAFIDMAALLSEIVKAETSLELA